MRSEAISRRRGIGCRFRRDQLYLATRHWPLASRQAVPWIGADPAPPPCAVVNSRHVSPAALVKAGRFVYVICAAPVGAGAVVAIGAGAVPATGAAAPGAGAGYAAGAA